MITLLILSFTVRSLSAEDHSSAHLKVGDMIPDVVLRNADSKKVSLRDQVSSKPAVLIFYRGGWCPFCTKHLMGLIDIKDELVGGGYQLLAISADQPTKIKKTPNRETLAVILRALKVSLVVGTLLNLINSGDSLLRGKLPPQPWKLPLTYLVPFGVSWYAGAAERRQRS